MYFTVKKETVMTTPQYINNYTMRLSQSLSLILKFRHSLFEIIQNEIKYHSNYNHTDR